MFGDYLTILHFEMLCIRQKSRNISLDCAKLFVVCVHLLHTHTHIHIANHTTTLHRAVK